MRTIWLVTKYSIKTTLQKRSFWIMTLIMPALMLGLLTYNEWSSRDHTGDSSQIETAEQAESFPLGLVDDAELIINMPPTVPADFFVHFPDLTSARAALGEGIVDQVVHIPGDYIARGNVMVYDRDYQLLRGGANMGVAYGSANAWMLDEIINFNLTHDEQLVTLLRNPTPAQFVTHHVLHPAQTAARGETLAQLMVSYMPTIFYLILVIGSGYLLQSVTNEKENRTAELLLLSLRPHELMAGKLLGFSVVTLIQVLAWLGSIALVSWRSGLWLATSTLAFSPNFFMWAALYLVAGYFLYASIMAAGGAIAPTAREGGKVTWLVVALMMPSLLFASEFAENPNGIFATTLSLFPLTSANAMVARLAVVSVPLWQLGLSLGGLLVTAALFVLLAGHFFRSENLLSQAAFSWQRLAVGWRDQSHSHPATHRV